jgi:hypothetical protein
MRRTRLLAGSGWQDTSVTAASAAKPCDRLRRRHKLTFPIFTPATKPDSAMTEMYPFSLMVQEHGKDLRRTSPKKAPGSMKGRLTAGARGILLATPSSNRMIRESSSDR